jgi:hypothetical protein
VTTLEAVMVEAEMVFDPMMFPYRLVEKTLSVITLAAVIVEAEMVFEPKMFP